MSEYTVETLDKPVDEDSQVEVLLIEDDPAVLEMYRMKLELDGYNVTIATDGEEGLAQAKKMKPGIIFLDIRLPKMDGFEVLGALRSDETTKEIPVVILSNYGEKELIDRGLKLGAHEFLIKAQTTPSALSKRVGEWITE
jgi:CheY-like chemotaxis protein